ncbi:MAG: PH domain-containing protein [Firmicutes bacterium]|nr:PH domain-containing protein [Gammaproteobacteria bacterium]MCL5049472.1 PH domain-containing protein [Bacillota bacterium]
MTDTQSWQNVAKNYVWYLRFDKTVLIALLFVFVVVAWFIDAIPQWVSYVGAAVLLVLWAILVFFWAPIRYRVTRYLLAEDRVHFQLGAWWWRETSVTHNRLQHIEIQQGPVERLLGISRLILYTAGGTGADLVIPGLPKDSSEAIRNQLLQEIAQEEISDEAITSAAMTSSAEPQAEAEERRHD